MLVYFVQLLLPFEMGISMVQSVWSSRGAGLGPSILFSSVHQTVSKKRIQRKKETWCDAAQVDYINGMPSYILC